MDEWGSYRCPFVVQLKSWLYSLLERKKEKKACSQQPLSLRTGSHQGGEVRGIAPRCWDRPGLAGSFTGRHPDSTARASIALAKLARAPQRNATASGAGVSARPYIRVSA